MRGERLTTPGDCRRMGMEIGRPDGLESLAWESLDCNLRYFCKTCIRGQQIVVADISSNSSRPRTHVLTLALTPANRDHNHCPVRRSHFRSLTDALSAIPALIGKFMRPSPHNFRLSFRSPKSFSNFYKTLKVGSFDAKDL